MAHTEKPFLDANQETFLKFVGERGRCFCIPAYQRGFTWNKDNFQRCFEDIISGIENIADNSLGPPYTFIGTIICFHNPQHKGGVRPAAVFDVIDGQQRLTMLMMVSARLHDYIRERSNQLDNWLGEKSEEILKEIDDVIESNKGSGERRFYPKMIRQFVDTWSNKKAEAKYHSPLSYFISSYGEHTRNENKLYDIGALDRDDLPEVEEQKESYESFKKLIKDTDEAIEKICSNNPTPQELEDSDLYNLPPIKKLTNSEYLRILFNIDDLESDAIDTSNTKQCELFRALVLASYVLNRIYFVTLVTVDENDSFDIFEALNTTGQVLTALETLKPEIVQFEGKKYEDSESKKRLDSIFRFTDNIAKYDEKVRTSKEMVINFALAEKGKKLSGRLTSQQSNLRKGYRGESADGKRTFIRRLECVSQVFQYFWDNKAKDERLEGLEYKQKLKSSTKMKSALQETLFCLSYLVDANHTISRSLIARFHQAVIEAKPKDKNKKIQELFDAIKATAAFFALWRSTRISTEGIDQCHRDLMRGKETKAGEKIGPFCYKSNKNLNSLPSVDSLRRAFVYFLREEGGSSKTIIPDLTAFTEAAGEIPIYRSNKATAKFLLLVASHMAEPSGKKLVSGRDNPIITLSDCWSDQLHESIEHIIPASRADNDSKFTRNNLNKLGNLLLLPNVINSSIADKDPGKKTEFYKILSAKTKKELDKKLDETNLWPDKSKSDMPEIIRGLRRLPMMKTILKYNEHNLDMIAKRGENLAERAWKVLAEDWLKFPAGDK